MKQLTKMLSLAAALSLSSSSATAHHISGTIVCTETEPVTPLVGVEVKIAGQTLGTYTAVTDANGNYYQSLPTVTETYVVTITAPSSLTITSPETGEYSLIIFANGVGGPHSYENVDFDLTGCVTPPESLCWMTAGGVKFEPLANENLAEANDGKGPNDSFGGNVYPSCSEFPGTGGHWNHVSHRLKLHLNGQDQHVIKCGNVPGTAPGTDSPVCDVNFIHWEGWGTISPINGGKTEHKVPVYYEAKVEDRAEPGNLKGAKNQPDDVDRYYIKVWYLNANGTLGAPVPGFEFGTYDSPIQITGGNLQIHCTSCD